MKYLLAQWIFTHTAAIGTLREQISGTRRRMGQPGTEISVDNVMVMIVIGRNRVRHIENSIFVDRPVIVHCDIAAMVQYVIS